MHSKALNEIYDFNIFQFQKKKKHHFLTLFASIISLGYK